MDPEPEVELNRFERGVQARAAQGDGSFAAAILRARIARGWTLSEAERQSGVPHSNISMMERGLKHPEQSLPALSATYGLSLDYLAGLIARDRAKKPVKGGKPRKHVTQ